MMLSNVEMNNSIYSLPTFFTVFAGVTGFALALIASLKVHTRGIVFTWACFTFIDIWKQIIKRKVKY